MIDFPSERLKQYGFFKYKVYHVLFWALYHLMWGIAEFSLGDVMYMLFYTPRYILFFCYVLVHTITVYITLYILLPRYLARGKQLAFIFAVIVCIILTSITIMACIYGTAYITGKGLDYFCSWGSDSNYYEIVQYGLTQILPHTAGAILLGLSIKLAKNWSETQKKQLELEREKLETELKFLKSQFNPHFLFNTINSIFFLIHKDPSSASQALGKFSELLRYQLYECNEKQIPLSQEIAYVKSFVVLEKLRKPADLDVQVEMEDAYLGYVNIAPFILMTFVENAFKHVSTHADKSNWIRIKLYMINHQILCFKVINSKATFQPNVDVLNYGGIGLKNVQRRLSLLYPDQHQLVIQEEETQFKVILRIVLSSWSKIEKHVELDRQERIPINVEKV